MGLPSPVKSSPDLAEVIGVIWLLSDTQNKEGFISAISLCAGGYIV